MGYLWSRTLPFVSSNTMIKVFRQALSLDEVCVISSMCAWNRQSLNLSSFHSITPTDILVQHRVRFRPNLFHLTPPPSSRRHGIPNLSQQTSSLVRGFKWVWKVLKKGVLTVFCRVIELEEQLEEQSDVQFTAPDSASKETSRRELWFKGCHEGVYFIGAMSSESVWELELYLWLHADRSQLTLHYDRHRWRKHERHNGNLE